MDIFRQHIINENMDESFSGNIYSYKFVNYREYVYLNLLF